MQRADAQLYLTDDILVKVDKASMLNSLETRTPLLDQHLANYVSSLPSSLRTRNDTLKYLLKRIAGGMLPQDVLTRRKHGFHPPVERWLRQDLAEYAREVLDSPRAHHRGIFQPEFVRKVLRSHAQLSHQRTGTQLWALLCLEVWFQVYVDRAGSAAEPASSTKLAALP
jgi:asparagine synthase (glutamine-hydrolysing)